ncbi:urease accessory protein UreD [Paenibacillus sepulcri]|uniref:Urease accessory protein UreD n=1 Tax=Paenibacillus sepulcri TaxID=359917 RepID=A0ABS7BZZ4_9BACL|nr:urease accessory protein UreD [Paenibacillus sepulcri]
MNRAPYTPIITFNHTQAARVSHLRAAFERRGGQTQVESKYHTAPVKIAKTFPMGGPVGVMVMDVSPGLLAGDRYEFDWTAHEDAHVYLTNQSFTKVHPCPDLASGSSMRQTFALSPGAILENMPEPVMLYRDAAFSSETVVNLSQASVWMQAEVLCPGRTLRGETFAYRIYRNRLKVSYEGELIFAQHQLIDPASDMLSAPGCFGGLTHTGAFYAFSDQITAKHIEAVRDAVSGLSVREQHPVIAGVTETHKYGFAVMAASTAAWPLQEALAAAWEATRAALLGIGPLRLHN